jgi:hypothetical protein
MSTKETPPTPTAELLEKIARQLVKTADMEARSASVLAVVGATPGKRRTHSEIVEPPRCVFSARRSGRQNTSRRERAGYHHLRLGSTNRRRRQRA